jgi:hypothetical protein
MKELRKNHGALSFVAVAEPICGKSRIQAGLNRFPQMS